MFVLVARTLVLIVVVTVAVRLMGKRTIGEMQASELVVTLLISDLASVPMQEIGTPLMSGVVPIAILVSVEIIMSSLLLKNAKLWRVVNGAPVVVVRNGEIVQKALRDLRMTNEDLFEGLRKKGVFKISTVKYAIVETDGQMSVLQYSAQMPPSAQVMGKSVDESDTEFLVVSDGDLDYGSINLVGLDVKKINKESEKRGVPLSEIFIMTATPDGKMNIIRREAE